MRDETAGAHMDEEVREALAELARACRILELEGQGDRAFGHMAMRDPRGRGFWMKRAGIGLGEVYDARDFVLLDFDGGKLAGAGRQHGEWPIHAEIFRARSDIAASAHTHPFYASAYSATEEPLATFVPRSTNQPVAPPRWEDTADLICTPEMGRSMAATLGPHHAVLLRNHGIVTCGPRVRDPVMIAVALEKMCREALLIHASGLNVTTPEKAELLAKLESGGGLDPAIAGGRAVWDYYCRKLARAEAIGDPRLAAAPVPIATG